VDEYDLKKLLIDIYIFFKTQNHIKNIRLFSYLHNKKLKVSESSLG
jgi:hypothetical protein